MKQEVLHQRGFSWVGESHPEALAMVCEKEWPALADDFRPVLCGRFAEGQRSTLVAGAEGR